MTVDDVDFLVSEGLPWLRQHGEDLPSDPLSLSVTLRRVFAADRARVVQEQIVLRPRAISKFGSLAERLVLTRRSLEQATALPVARHKARILRDSGCTRVVDVGCGAGGDALAMAEAGISTILLDADAVVLAAARANLLAVGLVAEAAVEGRAPRDVPPGIDLHLDPDRRTAGRHIGESRWDGLGWSPTASEILALSTEALRAVIKLPAAAPLEELDLPRGEAAWIGWKGQARELDLRVGQTFRPDWARVERVADDGSLLGAHGCTLEEAKEAFEDEPAEKPGPWLHEPVPELVRSHLFAHLGRTLGLQLIDTRIAWLTGGCAPHGLLRPWRVLGAAPLKRGVEEALLRAAGRSCGAVKTRGVAAIPAQVQRDLRNLEGPPAALAYTRVRGVKWAFVLEKPPDAPADEDTSVEDDLA